MVGKMSTLLTREVVFTLGLNIVPQELPPFQEKREKVNWGYP